MRLWTNPGAATVGPGHVAVTVAPAHSQPSLYWPFWLKLLAVQLKVQLLPTHAAPVVCAGAPQAWVQLPQLLASVVRLISQPLAGLPSQLAKPAEHPVTAHVPPLHAEVACDSEHAWPHVPQLPGS